MFSRRIAGVVLAAVVAMPSIAAAQTTSDEGALVGVNTIINTLAQPVRAAEAAAPGPVQLPRTAAVRTNSPVLTNTMLRSLYVTTATMQMLDVDSTLKALNRGAVEVNPLMSGLVKNRGAFMATKIGVAAATIYAANRMAKSNKVAAIVTMVAINSAYAMIVRNNYKIANR